VDGLFSTWLLVNDTGIFASSVPAMIDRGEIKTWRPGSQVPVSTTRYRMVQL
jgi:hypothetical protein